MVIAVIINRKYRYTIEILICIVPKKKKAMSDDSDSLDSNSLVPIYVLGRSIQNFVMSDDLNCTPFII
jgi:hypothetical protein